MIDPTRLTAIFRALSVSKSPDGATRELKKEKASTATHASRIEKSGERDQEQLKQALRHSLKKLKAIDPEFEKKAPTVVIKEILLWEFGEDFVTHPQFNGISQTVVNQMMRSKSMQDYFTSMVNHMVADLDVK